MVKFAFLFLLTISTVTVYSFDWPYGIIPEDDYDIERYYAEGYYDFTVYDELIHLYYDPIDINSANEDELMVLPGVTTDTAKRIIEHRKTEPFKTVHDIKQCISNNEVYRLLKPYVRAVKPVSLHGSVSAYNKKDYSYMKTILLYGPLDARVKASRQITDILTRSDDTVELTGREYRAIIDGWSVSYRTNAMTVYGGDLRFQWGEGIMSFGSSSAQCSSIIPELNDTEYYRGAGVSGQIGAVTVSGVYSNHLKRGKDYVFLPEEDKYALLKIEDLYREETFIGGVSFSNDTATLGFAGQHYMSEEFAHPQQFTTVGVTGQASLNGNVTIGSEWIFQESMYAAYLRCIFRNDKNYLKIGHFYNKSVNTPFGRFDDQMRKRYDAVFRHSERIWQISASLTSEFDTEYSRRYTVQMTVLPYTGVRCFVMCAENTSKRYGAGLSLNDTLWTFSAETFRYGSGSQKHIISIGKNGNFLDFKLSVVYDGNDNNDWAKSIRVRLSLNPWQNLSLTCSNSTAWHTGGTTSETTFWSSVRF